MRSTACFAALVRVQCLVVSTPNLLLPGWCLPDTTVSVLFPVVHFDVVATAQGSCLLQVGGTKVICAVFGPREGGRSDGFSATVGRLRCDVKVATFAKKHCRGTFGNGAEEKDLSQWLAQALSPATLAHTFPKAVVDVYAMVLDAHGNELAAVAMAGSCALCHAGIAQRDLVLAATVACVPSDADPLGVLILDPSPEEVRAATGIATVASMPCCDRITASRVTGHWVNDGASEALDACLDACRGLDALLRDALKRETAKVVGPTHQRAAAGST